MDDYRTAFQPLVKEFHRTCLRWKCLLMTGVAIGFIVSWVPSAFWPGFSLMLICFAFALYYGRESDRLLCPRCEKNVFDAGTYCPVCAAPIDHSKGFFGPTCSGCGETIYIARSDRRNYLVHHCPHCAALLSDEGV